MTLDIRGYSRLRYVGLHTDTFCRDEDSGGDLKHIFAFTQTAFPDSADGLPTHEGELHTINGVRPYLLAGCYEVTGQTERVSVEFTYTGYSWWRHELADLFNPYPPVEGENMIGRGDPDKPFFELLWFADNEGCMGPTAAQRLAEDFRVHRDEYVAHQVTSPPTWWCQDPVSYYDRYAQVCETAADGGLIELR